MAVTDPTYKWGNRRREVHNWPRAGGSAWRPRVGPQPCSAPASRCPLHTQGPPTPRRFCRDRALLRDQCLHPSLSQGGLGTVTVPLKQTGAGDGAGPAPLCAPAPHARSNQPHRASVQHGARAREAPTGLCRLPTAPTHTSLPPSVGVGRRGPHRGRRAEGGGSFSETSGTCHGRGRTIHDTTRPRGPQKHAFTRLISKPNPDNQDRSLPQPRAGKFQTPDVQSSSELPPKIY